MAHHVHPVPGPGGLALALALGLGLPAQAEQPPPAQVNSAQDEPAQAAPDATDERERQLEQRLKELEDRYQALTERLEAEDLERMIQDAHNEAQGALAEPSPDEREFLEGGLALQKLNPEITFSADFLAGLVIDGTRFYAGVDDRSGLPVRAASLHFQHVLDPYSMFKSAFHICPHHGLHLEEVYVSWVGLVPSLSFSVGRLRQTFGVLNRWHEHDLDQTQYPLALELVLGEEGLSGDGVALTWLMPSLWAHANALTVEVVDGSNPTLFAGEHFSVPSVLAHLKNYYDLTDSLYLELGLTGMLGVNNRRGFVDGGSLVDEPWRSTVVAGADLTVLWSPLQRAKYESFVWRSELFYVNKQLPDGGPQSYLHAGGAYSYVQYQLSERWYVGLRGDAALPTVRANDRVALGVVPYVTFWQSEFVYLRLEYRHGQNVPYQTPQDTQGRRMDNRLLLQIDFAAGPHKHEKY